MRVPQGSYHVHERGASVMQFNGTRASWWNRDVLGPSPLAAACTVRLTLGCPVTLRLGLGCLRFFP